MYNFLFGLSTTHRIHVVGPNLAWNQLFVFLSFFTTLCKKNKMEKSVDTVHLMVVVFGRQLE